jgi:hypothetical protein
MEFDLNYKGFVSDVARKYAYTRRYAITNEAIARLGLIAAQMSSEIREYSAREHLGPEGIAAYVQTFVDYAHEEALRRGQDEITEEIVDFVDENPSSEWPCKYWRRKRKRGAPEKEQEGDRVGDEDDDIRA